MAIAPKHSTPNLLVRRIVIAILLIATGVLLVVGGRPWVQIYVLNKADAANQKGDYSEYVRLISMNARFGDLPSMARLGAHYIHPKEGAIDRDKAEFWLKQCADAEVADCEELLGLLYFAGYGKTPDYARAKIWLERAAKKGKEDSKRMLDVISTQGHSST